MDRATWRWLNLTGRHLCPFLEQYLPSLPADDVQRLITTSSGESALESAFETYELFSRLLDEHGHPLGPSDVVLDFGCGWGRLIRCFARDVEPRNLWGVDVLEPAIAACKATNRWACFEQTNALPPSGFEAGTFTLVYAYSVFSHLSEEAHLAWLAEFDRLLKPNGFFIATTLPRKFIERCARFAQKDQESLAPWQRDAAACFSPADESLAAYDRGDYCFGAVPHLGEQFFGNRFGAVPLLGEHFGNACISKRYVERRWTAWFEVLDYLDSPLGQPVIVSRKR